MAAETEIDLAVNDLGPLAWVLDELRKSLDGATKALRRFVRDADLARGSDLAAVDGSQLRIARQQLHQAVGALEMVGLGAPALILRAMEAAVQRFVQHPEMCSEEAAAKVERASFALTGYLEAVLNGKPISAVALFPQYRDVQELAGADRVHPADLWVAVWRWLDPQFINPQAPLAYGPDVRSRFDQSVLRVIKSSDPAAARQLKDVALGLAAGQPQGLQSVFWKLCAGFFEALSLGLLPADVYVKRITSRVLLQYASLVRGDLSASERLAQDIVFFCAQAVPRAGDDAPVLEAVRLAYGLAATPAVNYDESPFGHFDPALLTQARKRIAAAKDTWTNLSGGDASKLKAVADQFSLVSDSLVKLHPPSEPLARALTRALESTVSSGKAPSTELAMEVATSVLYIEAAFEDLDPTDTQLAKRTLRLAERLEHVREGGQPEPLESWMEELYRRVSDRQTMGSVVGELRLNLGELEKSLDQFFRNPADKMSLGTVPAQLSQMRGVLSVLGLDQASQAVVRMRDAVEEMLVTEIDEEKARAAGTFDKLGNNLGALGFLIDMLNYQPALAKKLFVYNDETGELRPLMGRSTTAAQESAAATASAGESADGLDLSFDLDMVATQEPAELSLRLDSMAARAELAEQPQLAQTARRAAQAVSGADAQAASAALTQLASVVEPPVATVVSQPVPEFEEEDLKDIFLEEAREVLVNGLEAVDAVTVEPSDLGQQTTLRRAFHTLKGSSRMVGLNEFGEAAWALEQLLNAWLADQKPASPELCQVAGESMRALKLWVEDIARDQAQHWSAAPFKASAEALRHQGRLLPLSLPTGTSPTAPMAPIPDAVTEPSADLSFDIPLDFSDGFQLDAPQVAMAVADPVPQGVEIDFDDVFADPLPDELPDPLPVAAVPVPTLELSGAGEALKAGDPIEIEGIDFAALADLSDGALSAAQAPAVAPHEVDTATALPATQAPSPEPLPDFDLDFDLPAQAPAADAPMSSAEPAEEVPVEVAQDAPPAVDPMAASLPEVAMDLQEDEQVKAIGPLRIGIPLYNVYLNEADEWSRRLVTELAEWGLELHRPVPESAGALAHSLAGSSATVGFMGLSGLARTLEHALAHAQLLPRGTPEQASAYAGAAEEIRRLLHQFAAGFLKDPSPEVEEALHKAMQAPAPAPALEMPLEEEEAVALSTDHELTSQDAPGLEPVMPEVVLDSESDVTPVPAASSVAQAAPTVTIASIDDDDQDDSDHVDTLDQDLFPIFEEEAQELMPQLGSALRQWSSRPDNAGARMEVLRVLHTLKGSARLAGAMRLGEQAHRMESEIESLGSEALQSVQVEPLLGRFDALQAGFDQLRALDLSAVGVSVEETPVVSEAPVAPALPLESVAPLARQAVARAATSVLAPQRQGSNQAVRVRSQLLDRLVNQAGEVMITRSRLEAGLGQLKGSLVDLTGNLDRLRLQLRDIELQAESQMQSRLAQAKDSAQGFDPLEFDRFTRVQELTRMMAESVNDVATVQRNLQRTVETTEDDLIAQARQTRELQRDLLRTRMVEFEGISERLYRVVRQASKDAGKQVKLDITGGSIEMDRGVLDRMTPAFEHLLRNCVGHGIEDAEARLAAGKDAAGTITIGLRQEGNDVSVEFRDDGAGLNLAAIQAKAVAQGLLPAGEPLSAQAAADLIFAPGFSTATQVTELSGRGIGMDVVRSEVNALGGRIETTTQPGLGTTFKLVLPLTTAVTQVVMLRIGSLTFGVPANLVEIVRRTTPGDLAQAYDSGSFDDGVEHLPFHWTGALLQQSPRSSEPQGKTVPVVIFRSAAQRVAGHVDEVLGNQEVVVKNLGPQLSRLPGLSGMTVLASGAVVLIYNPVALSTVYGERARAWSAQSGHGTATAATTTGDAASAPVIERAAQVPLIMVVDDSITVRRVTQRLLQREGYRVVLAADGLQALERLQDELPVVVLSDIEMPRMDGFDLARNIRADARLHALPIIMITSRIAEKHREHARDLGVDHYLGKPYSEDELLALVRGYCALAAPA